MTSDPPRVGFIGLGNMGRPMATRLAAAGYELCVYDLAGSAERAPPGAAIASDAAAVAAASDVVLLSLPDGAAVSAVVAAIAAVPSPQARWVIDTSTIGIGAAKAMAGDLTAVGIGYLDAPVSGGTAGAKAGTLAMMVAGERAAYERFDVILAPIAKNRFFVGTEPGQAQAMKLLNNVLSATALVATSEAIAFGIDHGLDMKTMLDVLNVSSGQNTATSDKFPRRILPGTYDAGFATRLMTKDVCLYMDEVRADGVEAAVGAVVETAFKAADTALPGSDFTRIYVHVRAGRRHR